MTIQNRIVAELALYGISDVAFLPVEETPYTAIHVTDQPYSDHGVVKMIAEDILTPLGLHVTQRASNAFWGTATRKGAVFLVVL